MSTPISPDSPGAAIVDEEEKLLAKVLSRVSAGPKNLEDRVGTAEFDKELIDLRNQMAEARPEDLPPLVEQMTRLSAIRGRLGGSLVLPVDVSSPYFAHMGLVEGQKSRDVLIGKRGFIDREAGVQIVDWRNAPISQIYYRYDEEDEFEEEMSGRMFKGRVSIRRNVSIQNSRLRRIGTPQGTFVRDRQDQWHAALGDAAPVLQGGSGKAARAPKRPVKRRGGGRLGVHGGIEERADKHLPEIAALIDSEQFELITQPESGMVVIQGGAGSGKTTVALHRVAYLAFAQPKKFRPRDILFVVPTTSLMRYVADVLPSLGVRGVPVVTYAGWAKVTRKKLLKGTGGKYNEDVPDAVTTLKKHPLLLRALDGLIERQAEEIRDELSDIHAWVASEWSKLEQKALVPRLRALRRWLRTCDLPAQVRVAADSAVRQQIRRSDDIISDWGEVLTDHELLAPFVEHGILSKGQLADVIERSAAQADGHEQDIGADGKPISTIDGRDLDEGSVSGRFDEEDDPILLRLIQLKRGSLQGPDTNAIRYQHVAIDEAQDRSAIEVKVLLEAAVKADDGGRSITIAGDTAQRLIFDNAFSGWGDLLEKVGEACVVRPLKLSYRSTAEVMQLSREVLGPELAPEDPLVARSGAPVELHEFGDVGEAVAFLSDALRNLVGRERTASTCVVARYPEQADVYYEGLHRAEVPNLRRVRRHDFSFRPGVDVTDITQVKGLEFDYIVMVDVNANIYPDSTECRHLLHIGMTRAAHQLWIVSTGQPSSILPDSLLDAPLG